MNKKGQIEIVLFLLLICSLAWGLYSAIENSNPYNTFMRDCKNINQNNFTSYNQICYSVFDINKTQGYTCDIVSWDKLKDYCFNKYQEVKK